MVPVTPIAPMPPVAPMRPIGTAKSSVGRGGKWLGNCGWYLPAVLLSGGLGTAFPFAHAAIRLRRPLIYAMGVGYSTVAFVAICLINSMVNSTTETVGVSLLSAVLLGASSHLIVLSRQSVRARRLATKVDPALAKARDAQTKRALARKLLAQDPLIADELHIGRPDLGGTFDDGGLVDINHATVDAMASAFGISPVDARAIVQLRDVHGEFASVDEMLVLVELPMSA